MIDRFFTDEDGYDAIFLDPDDKEGFGVDCTRWLPVGAGLSDATVESKDGGVTVSAKTLDGNLVSFFLSGLTGSMSEVTIQFQYSNGGKRSHTIRVYRREF